jgi:hypothetical protein
VTQIASRDSPPRRPAATDRGIYIVWIAVIWAVMICGFSLDLGRFKAEPAPSFLLHVHAAVYVLWLALVTSQIALVETGNIARHRTLGWAMAILAVGMVPLGLAAALVDQARQAGSENYTPQFLGLEFEELIAFSVFLIAGIALRRDPAAHKRLMMLSVVAISDAGSSRLWIVAFKLNLPGVFGWWLKYCWGVALMLALMAAWDTWKHRRVHPAILAGGVFLLIGQGIAAELFFSPSWSAMMAALVKAWGYRG